MTQPLPSAAETSVTQEVVAHIAVADELPVSLPAELRYDRSDPYAVCLSIGTTSTGTVDWVFARSLLSEGMSGPVGVGDVLVAPRHDCHRHSVRIVIRSPAGAAVLDISASAVTAFLERARMVVPPGAEGLPSIWTALWQNSCQAASDGLAPRVPIYHPAWSPGLLLGGPREV